MATKKPYDWTKFTLHVFVEASASKVFNAWTDDRQIVKWFPEKAGIEPCLGGRIQFEWLAGDKLDKKITAFSRHRRLDFPFGDKGEKVSIRIKTVTGGAVCSLTQSGMKNSPKGRLLHTGCMQGWTFFLTNLKCWLEHGIDLRSHDPRRSYRQNFVNS